jgi:hypothetical protein
MRPILRHTYWLALPVAALLVSAVAAEAQIRVGPFGYPYGRYSPEAELKLRITPKEAEVYVDGYFAGTVDDFDGAFQRLRVLPGQHEIVVYLGGYRSIKERLYLGPNTSRKLERTMEKLGPGELEEAKPEPTTPPDQQQQPPQNPRDPRAPRRGAPPPTTT